VEKYMETKISQNIVDRAIELWCRELYNPVHDNGDKGPNGVASFALSNMNAQHSLDATDDLQGKVELFRIEMRKYFSEPAEYHDTWLSTDYHPCESMAVAADKVGIPHNLFSHKSTVNLNEDSVCASFGYGAAGVYHYPLPSGGWLITSLHGDDIDKVIDSIAKGNPLGFTVEGE
jgi:hypothetical protein